MEDVDRLVVATDVDGLIEFVERVADATGLPVGVKSAAG